MVWISEWYNYTGWQAEFWKIRMAYVVLFGFKHKVGENLKYGYTSQAKKLYPGENISSLKLPWGNYSGNLKGSSSPPIWLLVCLQIHLQSSLRSLYTETHRTHSLQAEEADTARRTKLAEWFYHLKTILCIILNTEGQKAVFFILPHFLRAVICAVTIQIIKSFIFILNIFFFL